jgi:hypothetical protein
MRIKDKISNAYYSLLAAATLTVLDIGAAHATSGSSQTVGGVAGKVKDDLADVGKLLMVGCGLGGAGMVVAGLYKLKQAADQGGNGQVKYTDGLWRLGAGACLVAVPAFTGTLTSTFGYGAPSITQKTTNF